MGDFDLSVYLFDLVQGVQIRRQATVQAKDLVLNHGSERKQIEEVSVVFPHIGIAILAKTLVIKAVDLSNLSGLMISSQYGDSVLKSNLNGNQKRDSLDRIISSVDVVTHEKIIGIR